MTKIIQFKNYKSKAIFSTEDLPFTNVLGPIQTNNQLRMLKVQSAICTFCSWVAAPVHLLFEKFDGGTKHFLNYSPPWRPSNVRRLPVGPYKQ